jgi:hypothetical protein
MIILLPRRPATWKGSLSRQASKPPSDSRRGGSFAAQLADISAVMMQVAARWPFTHPSGVSQFGAESDRKKMVAQVPVDGQLRHKGPTGRH